MKIEYDHSQNSHGVDGPNFAFTKLWDGKLPSSLLDVGCGTGTWLRAAINAGLTDVVGIDGAEIPENRLLVSKQYFRWMDLTKPIDLGRKFDSVLCLEVAEHLEKQHAEVLVDTLVSHSDNVVFSAAIPDQLGQHHVNCQWPVWWQKLFNDRGYSCNDSIRFRLWNEPNVEAWYRQNMFIASKNPNDAYNEPRIASIIHPEMLTHLQRDSSAESRVNVIENGGMPLAWYLKISLKALLAKLGS